MLFILNKKGASCSGYLPNSRVIAETLSKDFQYSENFHNEMVLSNISENFLKDSIITEGEIDFKRSNAQKNPCPNYILVYPKKNPKFEIKFDKCKNHVGFISLKKLK